MAPLHKPHAGRPAQQPPLARPEDTAQGTRSQGSHHRPCGPGETGTDLQAGPAGLGGHSEPSGIQVVCGGSLPAPPGQLLDPACPHCLLPAFHTDPSCPLPSLGTPTQPATAVTDGTYHTEALAPKAGWGPTLLHSSLERGLHLPVPLADLNSTWDPVLSTFHSHSAAAPTPLEGRSVRRPRRLGCQALLGHCPHAPSGGQDSSATLDSSASQEVLWCLLAGASARADPMPTMGVIPRLGSDVRSSGRLPLCPPPAARCHRPPALAQGTKAPWSSWGSLLRCP